MQGGHVPDFTSRQLLTVLAVAENSSFIAAASQIKTSQPAVTRSIKQVEDMLGVRLFDRSTRSVQITAAGKEFVAVAERMLNDLQITVRSIRGLTELQRGQLIISSIMSVAAGHLPRIVAAFRAEHPGIEIHIADGVHGEVLESVRSGVADLGITYVDGLPEAVAATPLSREVFVIVLPSDHELASRRALSLLNIKDLPLVSFPSNSRTRRAIDMAAAAAGLRLNCMVTVNQFATMLKLVRAGVGIAIAPEGGVASLLDDGLTAIPIAKPRLLRELGMIRLVDREPTPAAARFMALLKTSWSPQAKAAARSRG